MKEVCVVGGGLAGLAVAYFLQKRGDHQVTVYDGGDNQGASYIAAGLMHPFVGSKGLLSEQGLEGMQASRELLEVAEKALGGESVFKEGLYRVAVNGFQRSMFSRWSRKLPDLVRQLSEEEVELHPHLVGGGPVYEIKCGVSVTMSRYLAGLKRAFEAIGGSYVKEWVSESDIKEVDQVIYAVGRHLDKFNALKDLNIHMFKGQLLLADKPSDTSLEKAIIGRGYVSEAAGQIVIGSTYERGKCDELIDQDFAIADIMPKLATYAQFKHPLTICGVRAGVRVVNKDHYFPIAKQLSPREYVVSGMGSRGLLYHALIGKQIASTLPSS